MLNKLESFLKQYSMVKEGDRVICAVSGGADSVAMLFGFYLLAGKLKISLAAAHFNHHLRGEESDRDEAFVRDFCERYDIPLYVGGGEVAPGKKGLEAAAREARYGFLQSLEGKIATAHTADDNAETVVMHLIRGTGLKGLGGIAPVNGAFIRPMLCITRTEVISFLESYHLDYVVDSSNETDLFLRNRIRHHIMPLLKQENPRIAQSMSGSALRLREDEAVLCQLSQLDEMPDINTLRTYPAAIRKRVLATFLEKCGVAEPEAEHIALAENLVFSHKPSAKANFPNGIVICRNYDKLQKAENTKALDKVMLSCPGTAELPDANVRVVCEPAQKLCNEPKDFAIVPHGDMYIRSRICGDEISSFGGTKSLKKLFIDKKIPASERMLVPVICDSRGILGVCGFGANMDRLADCLPAVRIYFEEIT